MTLIKPEVSIFKPSYFEQS